MECICPVYNYKDLYEPPYNSEGGSSYEICPCCGFQFGLDDYPDKIEAYMNWRENWMECGCPWYSDTRVSPDNWDAAKQLKERWFINK